MTSAAVPARLAVTRNDLPEPVRLTVVDALNQWLADCLDLRSHCLQAHWNVTGPSFTTLHRLFDEIGDDVGGYADLLAERVVQLGGVADGTTALVAARSTLAAYPGAPADGMAHVLAVADALAAFGRGVRAGTDRATTLGDADTADILTEISRGVDKWLWFAEAHTRP